ncbi:MAG: LPS-assembly protein LptD [bacterium]
MLWLLVLLSPLPPDSLTLSADSTPPDIIYYGGSRARFLARENQVVLLDSAWVRYRDMAVYAESINYHIGTKILSAHRNVKFRTSTEEVTGRELFYNVDTRRGMMRYAQTQVENGYLSAQEAWLVKEKVLHARNAHYTTCEMDPPHYTFFGPRVKLLMDDVVIAQPVLLRIGLIPVLAAPFWLVPVSSKRKSGLMPFKVGNSRNQGYYAKGISYYWVINDYADATFLLDLMTKKGVQFRTEAVYIVNPYARGSIQGSYIREVWSTLTPGRPRYSLNFSGTGNIPPTTDFTIQTELISDTAYAPDYAEDRLDWLKQEVYSYATLRHRFPALGRLSVRGERHTYYMRHYQYTYLPAVSFAFNTRTLPGKWDFTPALSFSRRFEQFDSSSVDTLSQQRLTPGLSFNLTSPDYLFGKLDISDQLSISDFQRRSKNLPQSSSRNLNREFSITTAQKILGIFNTSEGISINQRDNLLDTLPLEPRYTLYLISSFSLFKVFSVPAKTIHGILHTATPTLQLDYEPRVTPKGLLGKIELTRPENAVLFLGINNGFQAKIGSSKQKIDFGTAKISTSFNLINHRLMPFVGNLSIRPLALFPIVDSGSVRNRVDLVLDGNISFKPDSMRFGQDFATITTFFWSHTVADTVHQQEKGWELRLNHTMGKDLQMITGSVSFSYAGWRIGITSLGYNIPRRQLTDYSLNLWRDLHCWEAIATLSGLGKQWRYDFEVRIKKLPDVRFGKSTFRNFLP